MNGERSDLKKVRADLARVRAAAVAAAAPARWSDGEIHEINPTLQVLPLSWRHLGPQLARGDLINGVELGSEVEDDPIDVPRALN